MLHFAAGFIIATVFQFWGFWMIIPAVIAGVAKELYDVSRNGKFDIADLIYTVVGGLAGCLLWLAYNWQLIGL